MKKSFLIPMAIAFLSIVSCNKDIQNESVAGFAGINVTICDGAAVKSSGSYNEATIGNVQLFVFDASGNFENKKTQAINATTGRITISCTFGQKTVYAVANSPEINPSTVAAMEATVTALKDNSLTSFVMTGSATPRISGTAEISISMKRVVSKIVLKKVTNALTGANAVKAFVIKAVYVDNVPANTTFSMGAPSQWYNRMKYEAGDCDALLYEGNINRTISNSASDETQRVFYVYPNSSGSTAKSGTWSPRVTRLVIEATLDGKTMYYPMDVPDISRNQSINYNGVTITRPGSSDPDIPVETGSVDFSISVADWAAVNRTEEI